MYSSTPGLYIIIEGYSDKPTLVQANAYKRFWTGLFALTRGNLNAPLWMQKVQAVIPPYVFISRVSMRKWFVTVSSAPTWPMARLFLADPRNWGGLVWSLIHAVSLIAGPTQTFAYWNWLNTIEHTLPCLSCATHSREVLQTIRFGDYVSRGDAPALGFAFHELVNHKIPGSRTLRGPLGGQAWHKALADQLLMVNSPISEVRLRVYPTRSSARISIRGR